MLRLGVYSSPAGQSREGAAEGDGIAYSSGGAAETGGPGVAVSVRRVPAAGASRRLERG
ncbi:MAG TPA: hypothetical protein VE959_37340 [Bryobacteraceae bacterium]|nr:hypothetical protein [Bryobacteraceae bacterium]